jgi:anti-sigma B factor antagonist
LRLSASRDTGRSSVSFGIDVSHQADWVVLHVSGELDLSSAPAFRHRVVSTVAEGGHRLVVDLTAVDHLDSIGIGLILGAQKRVRTHGGVVRVVADAPRICRVLELTDLARIVPVYSSVVAALADGPGAGVSTPSGAE